MADFCNQCAKDLGFLEGDLSSNRQAPEAGMGYPDLCEGCGPCLVDEKGNCVNPVCYKSHGCLLVAERIMEAFKLAVNSLDYIAMLSMPGGQYNVLLLMEKIAKEVCGECYDFKIVQQIHDEYVVEVSWKGPGNVNT
jgi:hypothetical protein